VIDPGGALLAAGGGDRVWLDGVRGEVVLTAREEWLPCEPDDVPEERTETRTEDEYAIYYQLFPLEVELEDGRFEEERTLRDGDATTVVRTLIEDLPAEEGEAVG
jgi:hypothetical protein